MKEKKKCMGVELYARMAHFMNSEKKVQCKSAKKKFHSYTS